MRIHKQAGFIALSLLLSEVLIAIFLHDRIIRPYGGDVLVVPLLYYAVFTFIKTDRLYLTFGVLCFAAIIESLQLAPILNWFNLQHSSLARTLIGDTFSFIDLLCYVLGAGLIYLIDIRKNRIT